MATSATSRAPSGGEKSVTVSVHLGDIPADVAAMAERVGRVGWDTETGGLDWRSARIATCQLFIEGGGAHVVRLQNEPPERLRALLQQQDIEKVFHHAPFDLRFMAFWWRCSPVNVRCTKISSKILEPGRTDHSLKALLRDHLGVDISKSERLSNWEAATLSPEQVAYAANDVTHLPALLDRLRDQLQQGDRWEAAVKCFEFLPTQVQLDIWGCPKIFEY